MADQTPISSAPYSSMTDTQNYDFANLVFINVATQATIRLTPDNFFTWKAQWDALLYGYALTGYVDGSLPCPSPSSNLAHLFWTRQDQLLFGSLLASLSPDLASMVVSAKTSRELWSKLFLIYAEQCRSRIIRLREKLARPQGSRSITTYMFEIKAAADELALLNEPLKNEEITIYVLKGLNPDLTGISAALRSGDPEISFEDLHKQLLEYEASIHKSDIHTPDDVTSIDHKLYKAAAMGQTSAFEAHADRLDRLLTRGRNTVLHIHCKKRSLIEWSKRIRPLRYTKEDIDPETKSAEFLEKILEMCPILLKKRNHMGETPLHVAAKYGDAFAVRVLINQCEKSYSESGVCGVSKQMLLKMKNNAGDTALHESIIMGLKLNEDTEKWFKQRDVANILSEEDIGVMYDRNAAGETPLYLAVKAGFGSVAKKGLQNMDAQTTSAYYGGSDGKTILHEAVISGFYDIDVILEGRKELCRVADYEKGWVPLHYAANLGKEYALKKLLKYDPFAACIEDKNGQIPLQVIADPKICRSFIEKIISKSPDCCELLRFDEEFYHDDHTAATLLDRFRIIGREIIIYLRQGIIYYCCGFTEVEEETEHAFKIWKKTFNDGKKPDEEKLLDKESTLVAAALIATVTFAAGFTLPGGYVNSGDNLPSNGGSQPRSAGSAVLSENAAFKAFLTSDAVAMALSSCAVFIHLFLALKKDRTKDQSYFLLAFQLIIVAMVAMVVAFMTGIYAVLGSSNAFAIASCFIVSVSFLLCIINLTFGYFNDYVYYFRDICTPPFVVFMFPVVLLLMIVFVSVVIPLSIIVCLLILIILSTILIPALPCISIDQISRRRGQLHKDLQLENSDDPGNEETQLESNVNPKTPSTNEEGVKASEMANNSEAEKGHEAV